jgi:hypothetical protein
MNNVICNIEPFKKYIYDSSAAIFSEESNKKHDWKREITLNIEENEYLLYLRPAECSGNPQQDKFFFFFDLELPMCATKTEAKELLCRVADAMQFHPNIKVLDRTEHSEAIGYYSTGEEPTGNNRYFWLRPKGFEFKKDKSGRYCWDEVPEGGDLDQVYPWFANMVVEVRMTRSSLDHLVRNFEWGRSFDLNTEDLTPVNLLRYAIRERDEKIAAEEARKRTEEEAELARKRTEEEAELARQKALEEQVRLENEKNFQEWERVKKFVDEIGDFEVKAMQEDGSYSYMPIRQVISFECTEDRVSPIYPMIYWVNFGYHMNFDCDDSTSLNVNRHGYDKAKKLIIDWAVSYGAREPEKVLAN